MIATYSNSLIKQDGTEWLANTMKHTMFMQMSVNSFNLLKNLITDNRGFYSLEPEFKQEINVFMFNFLREPLRKKYGIFWEFFPYGVGGVLLNPKTFAI